MTLAPAARGRRTVGLAARTAFTPDFEAVLRSLAPWRTLAKTPAHCNRAVAPALPIRSRTRHSNM